MKKILLLAALLTGSVSAADHRVKVSDFRFMPGNVNAIQNDTITWVWQEGSMTHTTASTTIPPGANGWDQTLDMNHRQYRARVTVAGTYNYICTIHQGMTGTISVSALPSPSPTATATFTPTPTATATATATFTPTPTPTPTANPVVLYAASGTFGVRGILYTLDPATGTLLTTVGPLNDAGGNNYGLTGLRYHPTTGIVYGATTTTSPTNPNYLVTVDPATALVTPIGPFGTGAFLTDLAIDPTTGTMYGVSGNNQKFYTVDTATGQAVQSGSTGIGFQNGGALTADSTGAVFGVNNFSFYSYNKTTGAATLIGPTGLGNLVKAGAFSPDDVFYGLEGGGGSDNTHLRWLVTFNVTTGAGTRVAQIPVNDLDALAFIPQ